MDDKKRWNSKVAHENLKQKISNQVLAHFQLKIEALWNYEFFLSRYIEFIENYDLQANHIQKLVSDKTI